MTEENLKTIAAAGFADGMRKSPLAYALVLITLCNLGLAWWQLQDSRAERAAQAEYVHMLHSQLVECHRDRS